mmetsp:Transcript_44958/g.138728  ORF Transcript_44958/g.138728 Transcript_44958/m.138728 type:complete len:210 (-) Transcript_44958:104-733(-)
MAAGMCDAASTSKSIRDTARRRIVGAAASPLRSCATAPRNVRCIAATMSSLPSTTVPNVRTPSGMMSGLRSRAQYWRSSCIDRSVMRRHVMQCRSHCWMSGPSTASGPPSRIAARIASRSSATWSAIFATTRSYSCAEYPCWPSWYAAVKSCWKEQLACSHEWIRSKALERTSHLSLKVSTDMAPFRTWAMLGSFSAAIRWHTTAGLLR